MRLLVLKTGNVSFSWATISYSESFSCMELHSLVIVTPTMHYV